MYSGTLYRSGKIPQIWSPRLDEVQETQINFNLSEEKTTF
jgi:hypothetical protein